MTKRTSRKRTSKYPAARTSKRKSRSQRSFERTARRMFHSLKKKHPYAKFIVDIGRKSTDHMTLKSALRTARSVTAKQSATVGGALIWKLKPGGWGNYKPYLVVREGKIFR